MDLPPYIKQWASERLLEADTAPHDAWPSLGDVYSDYLRWATKAKQTTITRNKFSRWLSSMMGVEVRRRAEGRFVKYVLLANQITPEMDWPTTPFRPRANFVVNVSRDHADGKDRLSTASIALTALTMIAGVEEDEADAARRMKMIAVEAVNTINRKGL